MWKQRWECSPADCVNRVEVIMKLPPSVQETAASTCLRLPADCRCQSCWSPEAEEISSCLKHSAEASAKNKSLISLLEALASQWHKSRVWAAASRCRRPDLRGTTRFTLTLSLIHDDVSVCAPVLRAVVRLLCTCNWLFWNVHTGVCTHTNTWWQMRNGPDSLPERFWLRIFLP